MENWLDGKVALVTGASAGLGRHFAHLLARKRATVILAARRVDSLKEACAEIVAAGGKASAVALDVTDEGSIASAFEEIGGPVDIVVNNAGISGVKPALEVTAEDWDRVVDTNLRGVFLVAQAAAKGMKGRGGSIINVASILGHRVAGNLAPYAASKAGVVQLTEALALEWAKYGIRVNSICPGYFETDINSDFFKTEAGLALIKRIPQRRLGQFEDLDGALLLLASDAGRYMTGSSIVVDGGHLISSL